MVYCGRSYLRSGVFADLSSSFVGRKAAIPLHPSTAYPASIPLQWIWSISIHKLDAVGLLAQRFAVLANPGFLKRFVQMQAVREFYGRFLSFAVSVGEVF